MYTYTFTHTLHITQIACLLIHWFHASTVHIFYNVYIALLLYNYLYTLINITSLYILKQYVKFMTTLWNKSTKHKKKLGCHGNWKLTINKLRSEKNLVRICSDANTLLKVEQTQVQDRLTACPYQVPATPKLTTPACGVFKCLTSWVGLKVLKKDLWILDLD